MGWLYTKDIIPGHPGPSILIRWPRTTIPDVPESLQLYFRFRWGTGKPLSEREQGWSLENGTGSNNGD